MLSNQYRQRLEFICSRIANGEEVQLSDMIWAEKLSKSNHSAYELLRKARRRANTKKNDGLGDFLDGLNLGDPDPSNHKTKFSSVDEIAEWFRNDRPDDWRQRD